MLAWRRGRGQSGRGDRGASAVEFAIVLPVLLLLVIGIIEFAFVLRDYLSVSSSVRVGARSASSAAGAGPAVCPDPLPEGVTACLGTDTPQLAQVAADSIQRAGTAMPQDTIDEIWVYKANEFGFTTVSGVANTNLGEMLSDGCTGDANCVRYRWIDAQNKFRWAGGSWDSSQINACINQTDAVGVYMKATHPFFTSFIRSTLALQDRAVLSFEPLPATVCLPGDHA